MNDQFAAVIGASLGSAANFNDIARRIRAIIGNVDQRYKNLGPVYRAYVARCMGELQGADPIEKDAKKYIQLLNGRFIKEVLAEGGDVDDYHVLTGQGASARTKNSKMDSWLFNAPRTMGRREDPAAVTGTAYSAPGRRPGDWKYGEGPGFDEYGIEFCDQENQGNSVVDNLYENAYFNVLNGPGPLYGNRFGVASPWVDQSLLRRRIFRSEGGVENAIPHYERRLYQRNYERNITENLGNSTEFDYHVRSYT